jgi:predicted alpha/beta hydrolase family esterase
VIGRRRQHFRGNAERLNTISAFWRQRRVIGKRRQHFRGNIERLNTISAFWRQHRVIAGRAGHFEDDSRVMRWHTGVLEITAG